MWLETARHPSGVLPDFRTITGLGHGMKRRKLFPGGRQIVSIPFDLLPSMLRTLREMPWVLPAYEPDGQEFVGRLLCRLGMAKTP